MTRRTPVRTAWSISAVVFTTMVAGAYLWRGPRAALMTGLGCLVVLTGVLVTWSRARALPAPRARSHNGPRTDGGRRVDGS
jgi:hypothetical protein